jgi:peptide/nickel transport system permease protein
MIARPIRTGTSFGLFALLIFIALTSLVWLPYDPMAVDLNDMLSPPSWSHWFGTDEFGRDVAARAMLGARISVFLAAQTVFVAISIGTMLGVLAGFIGGWTERLIMMVGDAVLAFPAMLLALGLVAVLGGSEHAIVIALAIAYLPATVRIVRSKVLSVRAAEFVEASLAVGDGPIYTMYRHVLPNALPPIIVLATSLFGWVILYESALSFLGVGVPPPTPSWGNMLAAARPYIDNAMWLSIIPGLCIVAALFGVNLAGDALRDHLDPRQSG